MRPVIGELEEGLTGSASPKDLETLFQLIHLTFTQPRADATIFGVLTSQMKTILANQAASPAFAFSEALQAALFQNHPRARPMTAERVGEMSLEKSFAFYKDRFADAGDFTFVFVGSFEPSAIKPLVERYLASLPSLGRKETWKDVGMMPAKGVVEKTVKKGIEPQSRVALVFSGPFQWNRDQRVAIRAMSTILETRLRETLREDAERHLRRAGVADVQPDSEPAVPAQHRLRLRPRARRRAGEGRVHGDRGVQGRRPDREAGERHPRAAPPRATRRT